MSEQGSSELKGGSSRRRGIPTACTTLLAAFLAVNVLYHGLAEDVASARDRTDQSFAVEPGNTRANDTPQERVRQRILNNFSEVSLPPNIEGDFRLDVHFRLDRKGRVVGAPTVKLVNGKLSRKNLASIKALLQNVLQRSGPFKELPADRYDKWSTLKFHLNYVKN